MNVVKCGCSIPCWEVTSDVGAIGQTVEPLVSCSCLRALVLLIVQLAQETIMFRWHHLAQVVHQLYLVHKKATAIMGRMIVVHISMQIFQANPRVVE